MTKSALAPKFADGDGGGGPFDPRDYTIMCLEHQNAEFRAVMRALLEADGPDAAKAIADAERLLDGLDQIDGEDAAEVEILRHFNSPTCDCGAVKGIGTSYCPVCDREALARFGRDDPTIEAKVSNDS